ncbi:SDR family oxidoreductase [Pseudorhodoferax soli]|uniref:NAD(P)-dependent dehydrogenase (Short-subunit alcohol dehydrogenase family) n=1 Tax=Pseudorhodoferax soli TaxID=545864 RepID=A0A368XEA5_9BURK|nr:SDR family oxidoreductase [Pseudorhodoferax soli]RCW66280.1 NAD(P)-dependent dehydrogenase (short-subunit alcohol dehydrogenase family) [Pseudorhodoferax soli]
MNDPGTVLITGGSRGIGAATARLAAAAGHAVCITYATQQRPADALVAEIVAAGGRAACLQANVGDPQVAETLLDRLPTALPPLYGLVNNAGITGPLGGFAQASRSTLEQVLDVNVLGTMLLTQQAVRRWCAAGRAGVVVNVSSIAATLGAPGEYVHYAASKAAVEAFTVGLAKELAEQGIRINAVSPGTTLTDIHAAAGEPGRPQRVAARIPMRRPGEAPEIAEAILWLLSDKASYVTGSVLKVAGGL